MSAHTFYFFVLCRAGRRPVIVCLKPTRKLRPSSDCMRNTGMKKEDRNKKTKASSKIKYKGRAIAQAVSRWLPTAAARVRDLSDHVGFVVDKVALGQVFSEYFSFPCQSSFHQILHPHNHPGQVPQANWWPTCRVDPVGLQLPLFELKKR
jgi:hypothetical protein